MGDIGTVQARYEVLGEAATTELREQPPARVEPPAREELAPDPAVSEAER